MGLFWTLSFQRSNPHYCPLLYCTLGHCTVISSVRPFWFVHKEQFTHFFCELRSNLTHFQKNIFAHSFTPIFKIWVRSQSSLFNKECALFSLFFHSFFALFFQIVYVQISGFFKNSPWNLKVLCIFRLSPLCKSVEKWNKSWAIKLLLRSILEHCVLLSNMNY